MKLNTQNPNPIFKITICFTKYESLVGTAFINIHIYYIYIYIYVYIYVCIIISVLKTDTHELVPLKRHEFVMAGFGAVPEGDATQIAHLQLNN